MVNFVYLLLVSSLACWLMYYVPILNLAAGIIWGVVLLVGGFWLSPRSLVFVFGLNSLLLFGLAGSSNFFFWAIYGIPSLIMGLLLSRQKGYHELQKWGMISAAVVICLYIGTLYSASGANMLTEIQNQFTEQVQQSGNLQDPEIIKIYEQQGISAEELSQSANQISAWLIKHLSAMYLVETLFIIQLILFLGTSLLRKMKIPVLEHRPFREEIMPWQLAWVVIAGLALWLWGRNELSTAYYAGSNLLLVMGPVTSYYGIAGIAFRWHKIPFSTRRVAIPFLIVGVTLLFLPAVFFVALLGLFDSLFDYRNLYRKKEEN